MRNALLLSFIVPVAGACAKHAAPAAPQLSHVETPEVSDGETPAVWREGTPGAVLLFVRNLFDRKVQDTAEDLADAFVRKCEPEYDAIAIVEPGAALAWPGIRQRAAEELAVRQEWRSRCLQRAGASKELADEDGKHQVQLIVDERNGMRHEVLGAADPGGDIVVAAFGARGEPVYRVPVKPGVSYSGMVQVVDEAIAAMRGARKRS